MAPYEDGYKALIPTTWIRNLQNEWSYLRMLSIEETKWCTLEYYAWFNVGGHRIPPSIGLKEILNYLRWRNTPPKKTLRRTPSKKTLKNTLRKIPSKKIPSKKTPLKKTLRETPIKGNHIEKDPEKDPSIYDPNDGGNLEAGLGKELENIPTRHPEGESEAQSEFRPEGHGEEGGWQMGDPEESSEDDFLKYLEYHPGFHYDMSDDDSPTWP
ncbi:hypothetical protein HAX54_046593 [Datura stramonium]|uniref:Uncharacterized protein n=1 Tax=Datura stramonium TaxID=4076 RepID=A0ABS8WL69_DATST|nr:hypothetical protein [Datura stramonium]